MRRQSPRFKIGQVVQVCICKGLDSSRVGRVIDRHEVRTDGRGVPLIPGHYKPDKVSDKVSWTDKVSRFS